MEETIVQQGSRVVSVEIKVIRKDGTVEEVKPETISIQTINEKLKDDIGLKL